MVGTDGAFWDGILGDRSGRRRRVAIAALASCLLLAASCMLLSVRAGTARAETLEDFSGGAFQILAPGEEGSEPTGPYSTDQAVLYNDLTKKGSHITSRALEKFYVSEKLVGPHEPGMTEEFTSRAGLEIWRDKHDIPHIFGATRGDVMYGSGWVAAQDRGLLLRLGLGPAFAAAVGVPGIDPFQLLLTDRSFTPSAESVKFVEEQKSTLLAKGAEGAQVVEDLEEWAEGINGYEQTLPEAERIPHVGLTQAIAGFAFIGSIFGNGGGNEVSNSDLLSGLENKYGETEGLKIFRDLREVNDPEAATTTSKPFPYDGVPTGPTPGAMVIDHGSLSPAGNAAQKAMQASRRQASNFLVVGGKMTKNGNPLAVMGPQLGYFYPEIVMQGQLHGPGINAEGIIAPISPYVFIGRGRDFAWSLTSADSENNQQFLEQLCNPDEAEEGPATRNSTHYIYEHECVPMTKFDAGLLGEGNSEPAHEVYFWETVNGPVSGTVTVKGVPYAVANDRSTRGHEPEGELAFSQLDSDKVHNPQEFFEAANNLGTTFNVAYLDDENIAYFSAGKLPVLAPGTDPSLPTLGNGEYKWKGFLSLEQHPHEVAPASNLFLSWNNKPAPEWGAASGTYSYGPVQRVEMFNHFSRKMTEAKDVGVMNRAATQDLRTVGDWPVIEQVLAGGPAPSKLAEEAANLVTSWMNSGASLYGKTAPENPGAAVMEDIFTPIAEAVLGPVLGEELLNEFKSMNSTDNSRNTSGSAFDGGWYDYVNKDLRDELGDPVEQPYSREYCGNGSLSACRASLWAVIQHAAEHLVATQGANPSAWRAPVVKIQFPPLDPTTMSWTNRSTFQQVIEFTGHAAE